MSNSETNLKNCQDILTKVHAKLVWLYDFELGIKSNEEFGKISDSQLDQLGCFFHKMEDLLTFYQKSYIELLQHSEGFGYYLPEPIKQQIRSSSTFKDINQLRNSLTKLERDNFSHPSLYQTHLLRWQYLRLKFDTVLLDK